MLRNLVFAVAFAGLACVSTNAALAQPIDLSTYRGNSPEARSARGHCWNEIGLSRNLSPQNLEQANAIRACVDKVLAAFVPARNAPPAQSERGRCIQQLPGSVYNRETRRYSNPDAALVTSRCGPAT